MDRYEIRKQMLQKEVKRHLEMGFWLGCIEENYDIATKEDPDGIICAECGQPNDHWDDIGWFYKRLPKGSLPVCSVCCGPLGGAR